MNVTFDPSRVIAAGCAAGFEHSKVMKKSADKVAFLPDGKRVLSGSRDGMLKLWDATSGQLLLGIEKAGAFSGKKEGSNSLTRNAKEET